MTLAEVREVGAVVLLRYLLAGPADGPAAEGSGGGRRVGRGG